MKKPLEVIVLAVMFFIMMAWVEWDYNPQRWHWITRAVYVFMMLLVLLVATYPGGGKKGVGESSK